MSGNRVPTQQAVSLRPPCLRFEDVLRGDDSISVLVNNAGVGSVASILKSDGDTMDSMIALNITALTRLTYAVAPVFAGKNAGTIINIASVVGVDVELLNGVYGASKLFARRRQVDAVGGRPPRAHAEIRQRSPGRPLRCRELNGAVAAMDRASWDS
jgi:short chain dehydrogenase